MKKLILLNENTDIKLNDTGTIIQFKAQNDGQPVSISNGQTATFRIKNDFGFVKSVKASSSYGGYVFELDTADLSGLVVGSYQVELLIQKDADDALIFPDTAFVGFNITANALTITGEQLPMMSLDEFKDELKTYVDDQTASAETAIKSDFQTYVDGLGDSTIATANKASQDAQTAITTANGAKSTAESAVQTANTAKSTADGIDSKATQALNQRVGGRNLLLNSEQHLSSQWITQYNNNHADNGTFMNSRIYKTNSSWDGLKYDISDLISRGLLVPGEKYTFSVYVKKDAEVDVTDVIYFYNAENTLTAGNVDVSNINNNEFTQISITVSCNSTDVPSKKQFGFETKKSIGSGYIYFVAPKFEKGDKATDYTPAPDDIESQISSLQEAQSTLLTKMAMIDANLNEGSES